MNARTKDYSTLFVDLDLRHRRKGEPCTKDWMLGLVPYITGATDIVETVILDHAVETRDLMRRGGGVHQG